MKKIAVLCGALFLLAGCGSLAVTAYDGGTYTLDYPSEWEVSNNEAGVVIEAVDGSPSLNLTEIVSDFGMEGYKIEKKEDYTNANGVKFSLIYNKIDLDLAEMLEWNEGKTMYENDTTFVMISTDSVVSPIFYTYDKSSPDGDVVMKQILDSFKGKVG